VGAIKNQKTAVVWQARARLDTADSSGPVRRFARGGFMSAPLLLFVSLLYWAVAIEQWWKGSPAGFVVWASYGTANWGLMWMTR
jgi:hypothetical protein